MKTEEYFHILDNMNEGYAVINVSCSKFKITYSYHIEKANNAFLKITEAEECNVNGKNICVFFKTKEENIYDHFDYVYRNLKSKIIEIYSETISKTISIKIFPISTIKIGCIVNEVQSLNKLKTDKNYIPSSAIEFLRILNHEIRTPLNGIMGMLQLMSDTTLNAEQINFLNIGATAANRLNSFVDILSLSRSTKDIPAAYDDIYFKLNAETQPVALMGGNLLQSKTKRIQSEQLYEKEFEPSNLCSSTTASTSS
ncbi:histidine kinase dimerization/phospho-acceptor domain-containing protein [Maridesulfovibrio salexigens]|uniref:histidine kinase n=1 Tax=Maridesulfovibrio salexigens (strain ATCC 14822 / DSM 2638 / NCIMB 8403 / VKM B-1763) TaxID=526222 RepID=C6BYT8_MARSD|nr:histidine kinase dimerization/phospho-acceptor domain-containing protein [Maridesulfovibrio salexigens]ACS80695.1 histidine kinase A domain protein [Maridesulfovibrio salexigens DSM 2638]